MKKTRKIDKRACRPYADPHLRMNPNNGLLISDKHGYIVRTAVKTIAGQRLLLLYVYSREQAAQGRLALGQPAPLWTVFQSRSDHCVLARKEDGSAVWQSATFDCINRNYYFRRKCAFYSLNDRERLERYCKGKPGGGFDSLSHLQLGILKVRRQERQMKKDKKTLQRMSGLKPLPRGLNGWIHRNVMPVFLFYDYQKKKGPQKAYCTSCQKEVAVTGAKYKAKGICPNCKRGAVFKSRGKRGFTWHYGTCQVIQKAGPDELVVRIVKVIYSFFGEDSPQKRIYENARFFIRPDEKAKYQTEPYHYSYVRGILTKWQHGLRPGYMNTWQNYFEPGISGHLYPRNLPEALHGTSWQYCQLHTFCLRESRTFTVLHYLTAYLRHPLLEYLVKFGLQRLAFQVAFEYLSFNTALNLDGKNIRDVLKVEKRHFPLIQSLDPCDEELAFIQAVIKSIGYPDEGLLKWCFEHDIGDSHVMKYLLAYVSPQKLTRYVDQQFLIRPAKKTSKADMRDTLVLYRDYVRMCRQMDYDLANSFVLFPRHLKKSHDRLSGMISKDKVAVFDRRIRSLFPILQKQYQFEHGGFIIIPPKTAHEIMEEGHKLHHCVGSYLDSMAADECTILFIRDVEKPDTPLCTVEVMNGKVKQARCHSNKNPSEEIQKFITIWTKKVLDVNVCEGFAA